MTSRHPVLILDDEPRIRETLSDYISDIGFSAECFSDAESALCAVRERLFSLAIVDVRLPGLDGHAFLQQALLAQPDLRSIIHTGTVEYMPQELEPNIQASIVAVLIKPVTDMQIFANVLQRLLEP
jgi:Response regulator containing CheY-like receiver, AAA-type ATPase, and DNA-binding domains